MLGLVVGVPGTYFSYRGWHDLPKAESVPSSPMAAPSGAKETTPTTTPATPSAHKSLKHTRPTTTPAPRSNTPDERPAAQPQPPDVSMTFYIEGGNPRFSILNSGDEAAQQPKWSFALADLTNEYYPHYPSDPNSSQPLPIPTNKIDDYVKPHSYLGNFAVFNDATASVIKSGDQIFGFVGISCANCPGNRRYWLYWEVGNGGWYSHFIPLAKDAQLFKQGNLSGPEVDEQVSRTVPAIARIPLQNGSPWKIDLSQP